MTTETPEQLRAERDFLIERQINGDFSWVGVSSDYLVALAICGRTDTTFGEQAWEWPGDRADLERCEETYRRAPEHLRPIMLPTLEAFRAHVAARFPTDSSEVSE